MEITLQEHEFPVGEGDEHSGELFATQMSYSVNITKYDQAPGTVPSTKAFRDDGERIFHFEQLLPTASATRRVYLVAEGLEFIWPFVHLGHQQILSTKVVTPPLSRTSQ